MSSIKARNAFFRGWFAARAHRAPPAPDSPEEKVYQDMGAVEGRSSRGKPLRTLSRRPVFTPLPLNIDMDLSQELPPVPPRGEAPVAAAPTARPATGRPLEDLAPAGRPARESRAAVPEEAAPETPETLRLPERQPQYNLPKKNPWGGKPSGKRVRYNR